LNKITNLKSASEGGPKKQIAGGISKEFFCREKAKLAFFA
jgi:hypothetical protein